MNKIVKEYRERGIVGVGRAVARRVLPDALHSVARGQTPLDPALKQIARARSLRVVQIGAFIGDTPNDPLIEFIKRVFPRHPDARAILIEPVREFFDQLKGAYATIPGIIFENVAIADSEGERQFHYLAVDPTKHGHPEWLSQLGSLRSDRMTDLWEKYEKQPEIQEFYLANKSVSTVACNTISNVLAKHAFEHIDFLQIDAEGYDFDILRTIDFDKCRPQFINYERVLLHDREPECRNMLLRAGYSLEDWGQDTLCTLR